MKTVNLPESADDNMLSVYLILADGSVEVVKLVSVEDDRGKAMNI